MYCEYVIVIQLISILNLVFFVGIGCASIDSQVAKHPNFYWKPKGKASNLGAVAGYDVKASPAGGYDLSQILDLALSNSTQTRVAWQNAKAAAADKLRVDAAFYPQLSGSVGVGQENPKQPPGENWQGSWVLSPSVTIQYMLFNFTSRAAASAAAAEGLKAANYVYNQSLQDLVLNVTEQFYALYDSVATLSVLQTNIDEAETTFEAASKRLKVGLGSEQDAALAESTYRNAQYQYEALVGIVESKRAALAQLIGLKISDDLRLNMSSLEDSDLKKLHVENLKPLIESAIDQRQDLRASHATSRQALLSMKSASFAQWPEFNLNFNTSFDQLLPFSKGATLNLAATVSIDWDIFSGFASHAQYLKNSSAYNASLENLRQKELDIYAEVWTHFHSFKSTEKQLSAAKTLLDSAESSFKAAYASYTNGLSTLINLLSAQETLSNARKIKIVAISDRAIAAARLSHALGRKEL